MSKRALWLLPLLAVLYGCRQDMHDAPRYDPLEYSPVLPKGSSAQPLVVGLPAHEPAEQPHVRPLRLMGDRKSVV